MKKPPFEALYGNSLALLTDVYQLTMAQGYWKSRIADRHAVYHLFFRKKPFGGSYAIAAGIETFTQFVENFRYSESDLSYLESIEDSEGRPLFEKGFLDYLKNFKFSVDIDAVEEGTPVFPYEPLIRVQGPIIEAQLLETPLLNIVNFQTLIATKASRICQAAENDEVVEFGVRRAQGIDGAISAGRAAYIGGVEATSTVLVGKLFGVPLRGTQAHSWIMAFDNESQSFDEYAKIYPTHSFFLIDTYDSIQGAKRAIEVAKRQTDPNFSLKGLRLDSGDLAYLSIEIRKMLDEAGFEKTKIVASNELDEYLIRDLKQQGAKIDVWGVGTNLITAKDQPALDGVYKLSAIENEQGELTYKLKISEQLVKVTDPGILQVRRFECPNQGYLFDMIYDEKANIPKNPTLVAPLDPTSRYEVKEESAFKDLLIPLFRKGECVIAFPKLSEVREKAALELNKFPPRVKRFLNPQPYFVGLEKKLYEKKIKLIDQIKRKKV
ncbi:MAG: nicotinate phosphoribosyltransferase [Simkaniaceae bacterium]